jgi:hypothetical protein
MSTFAKLCAVLLLGLCAAKRAELRSQHSQSLRARSQTISPLRSCFRKRAQVTREFERQHPCPSTGTHERPMSWLCQRSSYRSGVAERIASIAFNGRPLREAKGASAGIAGYWNDRVKLRGSSPLVARPNLVQTAGRLDRRRPLGGELAVDDRIADAAENCCT